jgi:hypothetical protein
MNDNVKSLQHYLQHAQSSQLANVWDLMHIVHDFQDKNLTRIRQFSYSHVKGKK